MTSLKSFLHDMPIDLPSYQLGKIFAFAEVVGAGVKKLAFSAPLSPEETDQLMKGAEEIAKEWGVSLYLEKDVLTTDLFDEEFTRGKHVLLIYKDPEVKDAYIALKNKKAYLVGAGQYQGEARKEIAREMGRLLSYQEDHIEKMLSDGPISPD